MWSYFYVDPNAAEPQPTSTRRSTAPPRRPRCVRLRRVGFYYQPYPDTGLAAEIEAAGYPLPATLEQWTRFDFVATAGPWIPATVRRLVDPFTLPHPKR